MADLIGSALVLPGFAYVAILFCVTDLRSLALIIGHTDPIFPSFVATAVVKSISLDSLWNKGNL